jgi:hypothetical protein
MLQLLKFLQNMIDASKIEIVDGQYKIIKKWKLLFS